MTKQCKTCLKIKFHLDFFFSKRDGKFYSSCKECHLFKSRMWKKNNKDRVKTQSSLRHRLKMRDDAQFYNRHLSITSIGYAIRKNQKKGRIIDAIGCSVDELKRHLEQQFVSGMSWENKGRFGWHVDHIIPLSMFDLTNDYQFKIANHYTNLRPLWWRDNLKKSNFIGREV